jgi:flavodoxin
MNSSTRILVVYYSRTGNTERVAKELATRLGADIESLRDLQHGPGFLGQLAGAFHALRQTPAKIGTAQHNPANYALTIIGTPVWVGQMSPAVRGYLSSARDRFRNVAFFVTSGDTDVTKLIPSVEALTGQTMVARAGFNARELADAAVYQGKVSAFVESLNGSPAIAKAVDESALLGVAGQPDAPMSLSMTGHRR